MRIWPALLVLPLLAACSVKTADKDAKVNISLGVDDSDGKTANAVAGDTSVVAGGNRGLRIDTDGFKAAIDIPGMTIGSKKFDIDGMKLYPGSTVTGMAVNAHDKDGDKSGTVTIRFTSPATPDAVLVHAEAQAKDEDYAVSRSGLTLAGTKNGGAKRFTYAVAAAGTGSSGTVVLTDRDG